MLISAHVKSRIIISKDNYDEFFSERGPIDLVNYVTFIYAHLKLSNAYSLPFWIIHVL